MSRFTIFLLIFAGFAPAATPSGRTNRSPDPFTWGNVFLGDLSGSAVDAIKTDPELVWWVQVGPQLLICAPRTLLEHLSRSVAVTPIPHPADVENLVFVRCPSSLDVANLPGDVLTAFGPFAVVDSPALKANVNEYRPRTPNATTVLPFSPNVVLVGPLKPMINKRSIRADIAEVVAEVNAARWFADVESLAAIDRYSYNPGIHEARDWLVAQLGAMPGLTVTTQEFSLSGTPAFNVQAVLTGQTRPDEWVLVGAHYDATAGSASPGQPAPGADDNASGTAGVLEMARIFTEHPTDATLMFLCFSGEEQGLHGSTDHSSALHASGDDEKVQGVIIMDMIGFSEDTTWDCLLETRAIGQDLMNALAQSAALYTDLVIHTSLYAFGSDHVPYLNRDMPAVLTIEDDWAIYPYYHTPNDLPAYLVPDMAEHILKMNVATIASLAGLAGSHASFGEYLEAWATLPADPRFVDGNANGVIDITELLEFVE